MLPLQIKFIVRRLRAEQGFSYRHLARLASCSKSTVARWLTENTSGIPCVSCRPKLTPLVLEAVRLHLSRHPFSSLRQLHDNLRESGFSHSLELTRLAIHKAEYSYKKARFQVRSKACSERLKTFLEQRSEVPLHKVVCIDECGFSTRRPGNLYGYAPRGDRLVIQQKTIPSKNTSVIAAITHRGILAYKSQNKPFEKTSFLEFLKQLKLPPKTTLLMDNVSFHYSKDVKAWAQQRRINLLYTPPYSPWFNPIENFFSFIKISYRKLGNINSAFAAQTPKDFFCRIYARAFRQSELFEAR